MGLQPTVKEGNRNCQASLFQLSPYDHSYGKADLQWQEKKRISMRGWTVDRALLDWEVEKGEKSALTGKVLQDCVYFSYKFISYRATGNPKIITQHTTEGCWRAESLVENVSVDSLWMCALHSSTQSLPELGHLERGLGGNGCWWGIIHWTHHTNQLKAIKPRN